MNCINKINSFFSTYLTVIILIMAAIACVIPEFFAWTVQYTTIFLGIAMLGMGLTIKPKDLRVCLTRPKEILIGVMAQYTIMPFTAWGICTLFNLPPDVAIGVILVGCCPGGTASNVITYLGDGDVSLSVAMTTVSTILAPFVTPVLIYYLGGTWVDMALLSLVIPVVKVVLLPIMLGLCIQCLGKKTLDTIRPVSPLLLIAIVLIIAGIIAVNRQTLLFSGVIVLAIVCLHNLCGLLLGLYLGKVAKLTYPKTTALAIGVGMKNSGLAVAIGLANFSMNPYAAVVGAIFSVWHNISGTIFANIRRRKISKRMTMKEVDIPMQSKVDKIIDL